MYQLLIHMKWLHILHKYKNSNIYMKKNNNISNSAESIISNFYNSRGWEEENGNTIDAIEFEDLRNCAKDYLVKCRLKLLNYIPKSGDYFLDMASGPIQYREYLTYSKNFKKRVCVDLSKSALIEARNKIGNHGEFLHGSFFDLDFEDDYFDCIVSIHTIYHMDKDLQATAIRKMLSIVKKGKPIIIIYSNPNSLVRKLTINSKKCLNFLRINYLKKVPGEGELYFYTHSLKWFDQFKDTANVKIVPWRTFGTELQKKIFPNNKFGKLMFNIIYFLEKNFHKIFNQIALYPMIIITKK